ncbi:lipid A disaccharide synthase [Gammaproteobacteria bacterium]
MLKIALVANEASGDRLGAGLMAALRATGENIAFAGVGGPRMAEQGLISRVPLEQLSVMGLVEVLRHLPRLLRIRRNLARFFLDWRPHVMIGIDAPDFNLPLEDLLKWVGIPTVHYVSPTVWAWRPGRVQALRSAADRVLSILPFEVEFLERHRVPVRYVGHPLADTIPLVKNPAVARQRLGVPLDGPLLALLPGSRMGEIERHARLFWETAAWCGARKPGLRVALPFVHADLARRFQSLRGALAPDLPMTMTEDSHVVLEAADVVLTASGTATLEALLFQKPMVVAYRLHPVTYQLAKRLRLVKVPYIAMSNLLADAPLAPEFIQNACRPEAMGQALLHFLDDPAGCAVLAQRYGEIHQTLRRDASTQAAAEVLALIREHPLS